MQIINNARPYSLKYRFGLTKITVDGDGIDEEDTFPFDKCRDSSTPFFDCDGLRDRGITTLILGCIALAIVPFATFFTALLIRPAGKQCYGESSMFVTGSRRALQMATLLSAIATVACQVGVIYFSTIDKEITVAFTHNGISRGFSTQAELYYSFFLFCGATFLLAFATVFLAVLLFTCPPPASVSVHADAEEVYSDYLYSEFSMEFSITDDETSAGDSSSSVSTCSSSSFSSQ